ncbi:DUF4145 domain-containing protein [Atlantibacter hermannii]|uniref:DUF4145 domain-containing protein n=1 Tax=Atlantibacter hermannii TaxID=565 RepID=UPI00254D75A2|nr:DUF4145 domain-containing protein [Atlantibacter hermannii]MDJ9217530.1 DUF4145 domain-containing protein [Salmonella enterica]
MEIHKISEQFYSSLNVNWPCPTCHQKTLKILKNTFVTKDSAATRLNWGQDWFDPEMSETVFICIAECTRPTCKEVVACSGIGGEMLVWEEGQGDHLESWYKPISFSPTLHPFQIPEKCAEEVRQPLTASFAVYLSQPGSAANLIRITVENMLTKIGVPKLNDKNNLVPLDKRIKNLDGEYASYKEILMAIKFLGNAGSHTCDEVEIGDIEDAFAVMEYVVNDFFSGRKESVGVITKRIDGKFNYKKTK